MKTQNQVYWSLMATLLLFATRCINNEAAGQDFPVTRYVNVNNPNPIAPFTNWASAATIIQQAVDESSSGDVILVTNGTYALGGRTAGGGFTNRVLLDKALTLMSVNGPQYTLIDGTGNANGVYLGTNASVSGFSLTNGNYGVWTDTATDSGVSNCLIVGNFTGVQNQAPGSFSGPWTRITAWNSIIRSNLNRGATAVTLNNCVINGNAGGGTSFCAMNNCLITGNTTVGFGGGAYYGIMNNCTVVGNSALEGGGVWSTNGDLRNSIIYYNNAPSGSNWGGSGFRSGPAPQYNCCSAPLNYSGGNITNAPLFIDLAAGNFRLQSNSTCINLGDNNSAFGSTDLDGRPRIVGGNVDIGAYEYQPNASGQFIAWLQQYGLPIDGSADYADSDGDGLNNWQEWRCRTSPTDALSVLRMLSAARSGNDVTISWQSVGGVSYFLERSTNLLAVPPFSALATNVTGQAGTTSYLDTNVDAAIPRFYRVGVGN